MFIFKLNRNNRGYSSVNFFFAVMLSLFLAGLLLDLINLFAVKQIVVERISWLAGVGTIQGGFLSGPPYGWGDFGYDGYVSSGDAESCLDNALSRYSDMVSNIDVRTSGRVDFNQEGNVWGGCTYRPRFMNLFGINLSGRCEHSSRFCGFWQYRYTNM